MTDRARIRKAQRGVSLVEILVVMLIAAMVSGIVVMSIGMPSGAVKDDSERLAAKLTMASDAAVTTGAVIGLQLSEERYDFYRYDRGEWTPGVDKLSGAAFSPDVAVEISVADAAMKNQQTQKKFFKEKEEEASPHPSVIFLPTGETTPLEVAFGKGAASSSVTLNGAGKAEVVRDDRTQ